MDEEKIPKPAIIIIGIILSLIIIQSTLFIMEFEKGVLVLLGAFIFMIFFLTRDKIIERKEAKEILKNNRDWFKTKYKLSKEIP